MENKPLQVAVLYGGKSTEHEVSVHSAQTVCEILQANARYRVWPIFIDKKGYWFLQKSCSEQTPQDLALTPVLCPQGTLFIPAKQEFIRPDVFFPVLHGVNGEDGTLQGLLECLQVPYVGCGVLASAMGMDKEIAKLVAMQVGVPTLPYLRLSRAATYQKQTVEQWAADIGYPVFVKPVRLGSSVGISKVTEVSQLHQAIAYAFQFDTDVLIEKGVQNPREIFCGVLGDAEQVRSSLCGELKNVAGEFFDYQAKYITVGGCETRVPAVLPAQTQEAICRGSEQIFKALRGSGLARVDFLVDTDGQAWFSEINTLPGLSHTSLYPQLFQASGFCYEAVLDQLIDIALSVHQQKSTLLMDHTSL